MKKSLNLKGFTLAETLVTLAIIGVIISIMLPVVNRAMPDENALLFRKSFYTIQEAVRGLSNDLSKYPDSVAMFTIEDVEGTTSATETYNIAFCKYIADSLNTVGYDETKCEAGTIIDPTDTAPTAANANFTLTNGAMFWGFNQQYDDQTSDEFWSATTFTKPSAPIIVCVDVNGTKGPNVGCSTEVNNPKKDQFRIQIAYDGKVSTGPSNDSYDPSASTINYGSDFANNWTVENHILTNPKNITKQK